MALNLNKKREWKVTINIPKWLIPGWLTFWFAVFIGLCFCLPNTMEQYAVPHKGAIVKLYTEVTNENNHDDIETVYKAIVREDNGALASVSLKDVYYHTANAGDVYAWTETYDKHPILAFLNCFVAFFVGIGWFFGLLSKYAD